MKIEIIREPDFQLYGEVKVDSKNRISISKTKGRFPSYKVYCNSSGQIILDPQVTISAHEVWLYKNPKALAAVQKGIQAAREGKLFKSKEDFSKYLA